MDKEDTVAIIDYCVFGGMLIITGGIGLFFSYVGNKSPEDFLLGNRALKPLPVALSLLTTYVSAISILGLSGEVYTNGMQISSIALGGPLGILVSSYFVLPVLYPLKLTSINEYIELRFKSKPLKMVIFIVNFVYSLMISGINLYAPSLAIAFLTKLDLLTNILLLGVLCTLYSSFGGIKAVIWTDVFQLTVMLIGLVTIIAIGVAQNGGLIEILHTASKGGRMEMFDMRINPFVRYTFFNTFLWGFLNHLRKYSSDQSCFQRVCAVKSIDKSRRVLNYNFFGKIIIYYLIFLGGLMVYVTYDGCDPISIGKIKKKDQIFSYFAIDKLSVFPGISGLFIATLMGGSLSSLSSAINSCVALMWRDVFLKFNYFKTASRTFATLTNKMISLVIGAVLIGIAILVSNAKSIIELTVSVSGIFSGPSLGVFMIGYFLPKCNIKGVWAGFILSSGLMLWLSLGSLFYKRPTEMLPFSNDECDVFNITSVNISNAEEFITSANNTAEDINSNAFFLLPFYQISRTFYGVFGPIICILLAVVVSFLTGNEKIEEISPKLISPSVRKFYWTKEKLDLLEEHEIKLHNSEMDIKENNLDNLSQNLEFPIPENK